MKKIILIVLILFNIINSGCYQNNTPLSDLNVNKTKSISIRIHNKGNPQEKVITNKKDISKVIQFFKESKYEKLQNQREIVGWQVWLVFDGSNKDISFVDDLVKIEETYYKMYPQNINDFIQIYENLNVSVKSYP